MENEILVSCLIISPVNQISKDSMILNNIKQECPKTIVIYVIKLYTLHYGIISGEKLHPFRNSHGSYGTVGMIGSVHTKTDETSSMCCISSPHFLSVDESAYFEDATIVLGTCIWPTRVPNHHINVQDNSVIPLESNIKIC